MPTHKIARAVGDEETNVSRTHTVSTTLEDRNVLVVLVLPLLLPQLLLLQLLQLDVGTSGEGASTAGGWSEHREATATAEAALIFEFPCRRTPTSCVYTNYGSLYNGSTSCFRALRKRDDT
ncbi:hypothetical protein KPH14_010899 [Odynerus spinipes]|uniref:Uncharacterized protein n=1 Tax=Odynerus spinipes TaxID=1348599 RepID=A0AAD9RHY6_9HYME|nr:hypothetical protein KPH14_010899 [Odynerus spinipes]